MRVFDHLSNMSLAFAAMVACGMDGMKRALKLPPPIEVDPETLDEVTRKSKNIMRLPLSFQERKSCLL